MNSWANKIARAPTLSAAGFVATMISFGPARMGFGLFVPEFRTSFSMSTSSVGLVSSIGYSGFLVGLVLALPLLRRRGPEATVLLGLMAASIGMGVVAGATNVTVLAFGVFLASSSAGLTWTPLNDAVDQKVPDSKRPTALSRISTGTSVGIAMAACAAFAATQFGWSWRVAWGLFAVSSFLALWVNRVALRQFAGASEESCDAVPWQKFRSARALSLLAVAFVMGATSAIYVAFAADRMTQAGGVAGLPDDTTPALVFFFYGLFGLAGLLTGRLRRVIGFAPLLRGTMLAGAASAALVALLPGSWAGLVLSAGLQGVHVMMTSAIMAFWSGRLYPAGRSVGFTATLFSMAAGTVLGPAAAGLASDAYGAGSMFMGSAAFVLLTAILLRRRDLFDRPETGSGGG